METDIIVITQVDTLLGYALAYRFLEEWNRSKQRNTSSVTEFRLVCQDTEGLEELVRLGGKIIQVPNDDDEEMLRKVLYRASYLMYLPSNSQQRTKIGEMVFRCAKEQGVHYVAMFSYIGLDKLKDSHESDKFPNLKQYYELETKLSQCFDKSHYCVFRSTLWHQFFYTFGPMIEDENKIQLPVRKDSKWGTINLADLVDAVFNLSVPPKDNTNLSRAIIEELRKKNKTMFEFTPDHDTITAKELVKAASKGLEFTGDLQYEQVKPKDMMAYLQRIHNDNRFRHRPTSSVSGHEERHYTFPLGKYFNDNVIKALVEYWEFADKGYTDMTQDDLRNALDKSPESIEKFFEHNQNQFKRLR